MKKIQSKAAEIAKRYLSGKLVVVQFLGGCSAFAFRTTVAYFTTYKFHLPTWDIVLSYTLASNLSYIATWSIGYIVAFRKDYHRVKRPMWPDVVRLQLIEQTPNLVTLVPSALFGLALINNAGISPMVSTNLASWFGPQKVLNLCAAIISNATKKAWVDKTWSPAAITRRILQRGKSSQPVPRSQTCNQNRASTLERSSVTKSGRLLRIGITIIIMIAATEFAIGIYHLTHQGRGSGITEPISALLLVTGICLASRAMKNIDSPGRVTKRTYLFLSGIAIIVLLTLLAFYLGVYHLAHHGVRSATIELLSTSLLATAIYLVLRAWDDLRIAEVPRMRAHAWARILCIASVGVLILAGIAYAAVHSPA